MTTPATDTVATPTPTPAAEAGFKPDAALAFAVALVGAGVLGVGLFVYGMMLSQTQRFTGDVVALVGLAGYLAVWAVGILFVKHAEAELD